LNFDWQRAGVKAGKAPAAEMSLTFTPSSGNCLQYASMKALPTLLVAELGPIGLAAITNTVLPPFFAGKLCTT
jgi:hypothetical protein